MHNGHVSVKEAVLPFARFAGADAVLGPGDEVDRRGHGHRGRLPDRVRQGPGGGRGRAPQRGHGVHHGHRYRQAGRDPARGPLPRRRLRDHRHGRNRAGDLADGDPGARRSTRSPRARPTSSTSSATGPSTSSSTRRRGAGRAPTDTRSARRPPRRGIPCITTMTGASAATRAIVAARERGAEPRSRSRSCTGSPPSARPPRGRAVTRARRRRRRARRAARGRRPTGPAAATGSSRRSTPRARARGRPVLHAVAAEGWSGEEGRPFLPRAFSVAAASRPRRRPAGLPGRGGGPGTSRLAALAAGDGLCLTGPLGRPFSAPARALRGRRGRDPRRRRDRDRAARDPAPAAREAGRPAAGPAGLSRPRALGRRRGAVRLRGDAPGQRGRPRRPPRLRHRPAGGDARRRRGGRRPSSTPAVRRRCSRPCAPSAPSTASPAELAMESPMACGYGACFGCAVPLADGGYMRLCVDGPVVEADEIETALVAGAGHR